MRRLATRPSRLARARLTQVCTRHVEDSGDLGDGSAPIRRRIRGRRCDTVSTMGGVEPANGSEDPERDFTLVDGAIALMIDERVYRLSAVKKAAYRMADRCTAVIGAPADPLVPLTLRFKPGTTDSGAREAARLFFQELLDQELREQIADETNAMRTLILAHAFSKADLIQRDE
jgi:His-Xaa-Ser system protein HxsD